MIIIDFSDNMWPVLKGLGLEDVTAAQCDNIGFTRIAYAANQTQWDGAHSTLARLRVTLKGSAKRSITAAMSRIQTTEKIEAREALSAARWEAYKIAHPDFA